MDQGLISNHIEGVEIFPLQIFRDDRGAVMHVLRSNQPHATEVGEVYCSLVNPGVVKGWKRHKIVFQSMSVPEGMMRMVIYDDRPTSQTKGKFKIVDFGIDNYVLLRIPPMVWYSFSAISNTHSIIVNVVNRPHDPDESETMPLQNDYIPYFWN